MKALDSLIRLRRLALDDKRRQLRELEHLEDRLRSQYRLLEEELTAEQRVARAGPVEAGLTYGSYASGVVARRERLQSSIDEVLAQIEQMRTQLGAAFEELKRFEITRDRKLVQARQAAERREQQFLDEVGLNQFRRRSRA